MLKQGDEIYFSQEMLLEANLAHRSDLVGKSYKEIFAEFKNGNIGIGLYRGFYDTLNNHISLHTGLTRKKGEPYDVPMYRYFSPSEQKQLKDYWSRHINYIHDIQVAEKDARELQLPMFIGDIEYKRIQKFTVDVIDDRKGWIVEDQDGVRLAVIENIMMSNKIISLSDLEGILTSHEKELEEQTKTYREAIKNTHEAIESLVVSSVPRMG